MSQQIFRCDKERLRWKNRHPSSRNCQDEAILFGLEVQDKIRQTNINDIHIWSAMVCMFDHKEIVIQ